MTAYYNEIDPYCARELKSLVERKAIPYGHVDTRSILDVRPADLAGFTQCHFFAGIGGWPLALRLAGCSDNFEVWTGSCPCQPFSTAGRASGFADERHLWPYWFHLIQQRCPPILFGEQVASAGEWLRLVRGDLEALGYAVGVLPIEAQSIGAPHKRDRYFFAAYAAGDGRQGIQRSAEAQIQENGALEALASWDRPGDPFANWRELLAQSDVRRMADGVSSNVDVRPRLRAYGNAIVPQVAAAFIKAAL